MWVDTALKCPNHEDWLAVVRVTSDGETTLVSYLGAIPDDAEAELDAVQQRWVERETWPKDERVQDACRIAPVDLQAALYPEG